MAGPPGLGWQSIHLMIAMLCVARERRFAGSQPASFGLCCVHHHCHFHLFIIARQPRKCKSAWLVRRNIRPALISNVSIEFLQLPAMMTAEACLTSLLTFVHMYTDSQIDVRW
ncbi:hypothetical protein EDC01DRAFT_478016 [Geopyxis carbonaria]|nr:hypothetical protein EDC01DRAFT_478016 [Geopyxis carbonaria]